MQKFHYVIVVSDHNLAELRSCRYWHKKEALLSLSLIITQRMEKPATRLTHELRKLQPPLEMVELRGDTFKGERLKTISLPGLRTPYCPVYGH